MSAWRVAPAAASADATEPGASLWPPPVARPISRCSAETYSSSSSRATSPAADIAWYVARPSDGVLTELPLALGRARRAASAARRSAPGSAPTFSSSAGLTRVGLRQQGGQQVCRLDLGVAVRRRAAHGRGHRLLATGGELQVHGVSVLRGLRVVRSEERPIS